MKKIILALAFLSNVGYSVTAGKVWRVPSSGSLVPSWGAVDLANSSSVTGILPSANVAARTVISSSSGTSSTTSTSYQDVTNLSISVTTTGGPIMVLIGPDGAGGNSTYNCGWGSGSHAFAECFIQIVRDSTVVFTTPITISGASGAISAQIPAIWHLIDSPSAGTYTYKVQQKSNSGESSAFAGVKLQAFNL